jgi:hypothetical protein
MKYKKERKKEKTRSPARVDFVTIPSLIVGVE